MGQITFQNWREAHSFIEQNLFYPEGKNCRWGRIWAKWVEKGSNGKNLTHLCAFAIDLQNGDIYFDCRKQKIYAKFAAISLSRPFFGLTRTVYHLCLPVSIPLEIFKSITHHYMQHPYSLSIIGWDIGHNIKNNIEDIIRTPLYTIALTVVAIAALIISPFAPNKLYDLRALAGRLENALNRGEESFWTAAPCFQPLDNMMNIQRENYIKIDTEYEAEPTLHGLNNLVRSYVKFKRANRNLFNNCGRLQPKDKPYVSAGYSIA